MVHRPRQHEDRRATATSTSRSGAAAKVLKLSPEGKLLHVFDIAAGDGTTNVAFGPDEKDLYVTVVKDPNDPQAAGSVVKARERSLAARQNGVSGNAIFIGAPASVVCRWMKKLPMPAAPCM